MHKSYYSYSIALLKCRRANGILSNNIRFAYVQRMERSLADLVRYWRTQRGLTQGAAADLVGLSQPSFSRIERGGSIPDRDSARAFIAAGAFTAEQLGHAIVAPASEAA